MIGWRESGLNKKKTKTKKTGRGVGASFSLMHTVGRVRSDLLCALMCLVGASLGKAGKNLRKEEDYVPCWKLS